MAPLIRRNDPAAHREYASGCRQDTDPAVRQHYKAGAEDETATSTAVPPLDGGPCDHESEATHAATIARELTGTAETSQWGLADSQRES